MGISVETASYVCVHCGFPTCDLYQQVGQEIRLRECKSCGQNVDHYIEFEVLLVFIDLQLFREEVYRHILHNRFATDSWRLRREAWKFLFICLMLDSHAHWLFSRCGQMPPSVAGGADGLAILQWLQQRDGVGSALLLGFCDTAAYLLTISSAILWVQRGGDGLRPSPSGGDVVVALSVASFGKLYALLALVWGGDQRWHMQLAVSLFVAASNVVGVKAATRQASWRAAALVVAVGVAARVAVSGAVRSLVGL